MKTPMYKTIAGRQAVSKLFWSLVITGLLLLLPAARAQFTWPVYEPFGEYTATTNLAGGDSTNNWNFGNGGGAGVGSYIVTPSAAMSYPDLLPESNAIPAGVASVPVLTTSADAGAMFNTNLGNIYVSFLLNYMDNGASVTPPGDRVIFNLIPDAPTNGSFTHFYTVVALTADYRIKIDKDINAGGTYSATTPVLSTNVTHLIVLSYTTNKVAGAPDTVSLWVDPTPFGTNSAIPVPTLTTTNGANVTNSAGIAEFNGFLLDNRAAPAYYANLFYIDEIRVNNNWAGVTPLASPFPGPTFTVKGGGASCGNPEDVSLSGSVSSNTYSLYTNAVYAGVTLPGTGAALDFGLQSALGSYSVLASNVVNSYIGWMSNSVTVAILQAPVFISEPSPIVVATNNRAFFTTVVTGNGLVYQWYRNGIALTNDSHLTGATTNSLVITPTTTADLGNYYCYIIDVCGNTAYTTTNSLSLDAPSTLEWAGDGFNVDIWDIATSAEWNGGDGFFNPGDIVTFDDTYPYANSIALNGVLTPTTITVSAARNYTWVNGSQGGTITGSATLTKSGNGTLLVNNNSANGYLNSYTGGTIINAGSIDISNSWTSLGSGPVTLAGGTLESYQKGSGTGTNSSSGLVNNLIVTANSTWQVDRTGNQCAGLVGTLTGTPGTTLSIYNSAVTENSQNWVRLGGLFTNSIAIALSGNSTPTNSPLFLATYHSSPGAQVYNAPISGHNSALLVEGTGSVYLNAANTYTGPTTNVLGFLAGSGSIAGPLVVTTNASMGAGSADAIGTFTVNNNAILGGKFFIRVNKALSQPNDEISVAGTLTNVGPGTLTITNIGTPALAVGDSFQIFNEAISNGAAITVTGSGVSSWVNNLAVNGSVQISALIASYPTNITASFGGGKVNLTWPTTHLGWILQTETNSLAVGLTNNWVDISATANVTSTNFTINPANPDVFYRLRHP